MTKTIEHSTATRMQLTANVKLNVTTLAGLIILLMFSATPALAERSFVIEMVVFKRNYPEASEAPVVPALAYPANIQEWPEGRRTNNEVISNLPFEGNMKSVADQLERSSAFRVLFKKRWQQQLVSNRQAPSLLINGGRQAGGHYELEGSVKFGVNRYLHLSTNLWLSGLDSMSTEPVEVNGGFQQDEPPTARSGEHVSLPANPLTRAPAASTTAQQLTSLQQGRRMRSREFHYIDHPKMGMIVRIEPVETSSADNAALN